MKKILSIAVSVFCFLLPIVAANWIARGDMLAVEWWIMYAAVWAVEVVIGSVIYDRRRRI